MMLADFGSEDPGAPCSKDVRVVPNTPDLIITYAYVGVFCTSIKKVCDTVEKQILMPIKDVEPPKIDTAFYWILNPR